MQAISNILCHLQRDVVGGRDGLLENLALRRTIVNHRRFPSLGVEPTGSLPLLGYSTSAGVVIILSLIIELFIGIISIVYYYYHINVIELLIIFG